MSRICKRTNDRWQCEPYRIAVAGLFLACAASAPLAEVPWLVDVNTRREDPPASGTAGTF
jgi:hypothetical protein